MNNKKVPVNVVEFYGLLSGYPENSEVMIHDTDKYVSIDENFEVTPTEEVCSVLNLLNRLHELRAFSSSSCYVWKMPEIGPTELLYGCYINNGVVYLVMGD